MPYSIPWDETQPDGSEPASTIDTEIRDVKTAIRERIESIIPGWGNDATEPKILNLSGHSIAQLTGTERARVSIHTNRSITNAVFTPIEWTTEEYDVGSMVNLAVHPTRITIPVSGIYLITANMEWDAGTTGLRSCMVIRNGIDVIASANAQRVGPLHTTRLSCSTMHPLNASDYLQLYAYHNDGGSLDVVAVSDLTSMAVLRIA
jgi:hypothetical protein